MLFESFKKMSGPCLWWSHHLKWNGLLSACEEATQFQNTLGSSKHTVDERNPAPVDRWFTLLFIGFLWFPTIQGGPGFLPSSAACDLGLSPITNALEIPVESWNISFTIYQDLHIHTYVYHYTYHIMSYHIISIHIMSYQCHIMSCHIPTNSKTSTKLSTTHRLQLQMAQRQIGMERREERLPGIQWGNHGETYGSWSYASRTSRENHGKPLERKMMKDGAGTEWNQLIQNWRFWDDVSSEKIGFWPAKHGLRWREQWKNWVLASQTRTKDLEQNDPGTTVFQNCLIWTGSYITMAII